MPFGAIFNTLPLIWDLMHFICHSHSGIIIHLFHFGKIRIENIAVIFSYFKGRRLIEEIQ